MFLKKVYQHNKWMFAGMLTFLVLQIVCFYKKGMVFSPFYNYGMYSAVIDPQTEYAVTKVYADEQLLQGNNFSPPSWDRIHYNLQQAVAADCNLHFYATEISRIFKKFHLSPPDPSLYYNSQFTKGEILDQQQMATAGWLQAKSLTVYNLRYIWNGSHLVLKDTLFNLTTETFLCH